jgi:hypothetical protein
MNANPTESSDMAGKSTPIQFRMSESDLAPVKRAAEAANLNMSTVIRECLVRYGQQTIVEIATNREFEAESAYKVSGKRRPPRVRRDRTVKLVDMVAWKWETTSELAERWVKLGRIAVDGQVVEDPAAQIPDGSADSVTKSD